MFWKMLYVPNLMILSRRCSRSFVFSLFSMQKTNSFLKYSSCAGVKEEGGGRGDKLVMGRSVLFVHGQVVCAAALGWW